jgi:hypothetical protein
VLEKEDASPEMLATAFLGIGQQYEAGAKPAQARAMYKECLKKSPPADIRAQAEARLKALAAGTARSAAGTVAGPKLPRRAKATAAPKTGRKPGPVSKPKPKQKAGAKKDAGKGKAGSG